MKSEEILQIKNIKKFPLIKMHEEQHMTISFIQLLSARFSAVERRRTNKKPKSLHQISSS